MGRKKTADLARMGRRRFVETLVALGVTSTAAAGMSAEDLEELTDDPTDEVPRLSGYRRIDPEDGGEPSYEPVYYTIPRDKYVRVETAYDAASKISDRVSDLKGGGSYSVGVSSRTNGHHSEKVVRVTRIHRGDDKTDEDESSLEIAAIEDRLPTAVTGEVPAAENAGKGSEKRGELADERVEDIPVVIEEVTEEVETCNEDFAFTSRDRPVTGGMGMNSGTTGFVQFDHGQGHRVVVTHAHGWIDGDDGETSTDALGDSAHQPSRDWWRQTKIGEIEKAAFHRTDFGVTEPMDAATIELTDDWVTYIAGVDDSKGEFVDGRFSLEALKDKEDDGDYLSRQGKTTGRCAGTFELKDNNGYTEIELETSSDPGDSGGPYFGYGYRGNLFAAGIHRAGRTKSDGSVVPVGLFIEDIREELNMTL